MDELDTPNCPSCLTRMDPVDGPPRWECSVCGMVKLP